MELGIDLCTCYEFSPLSVPKGGFLFFRDGVLAKKGKGYTLFSLGAAIFCRGPEPGQRLELGYFHNKNQQLEEKLFGFRFPS